MCHFYCVSMIQFILLHPTHTCYERPNESHMMQLAFGMAIKWFEICFLLFFFSRVLSKLVAHWCETAAHLLRGQRNWVEHRPSNTHTHTHRMHRYESCDRCPSIVIMMKSDNLWLNCDFSNFKLIINWQLRFHIASNHIMWASLVLVSSRLASQCERTFVYWFISFEGKFIDFSFWLCAACTRIYDISLPVSLSPYICIYIFPISVERCGCGITTCTCFFLSFWLEGKRKTEKKIQKGERDLTAQTVYIYILLHIFFPLPSVHISLLPVRFHLILHYAAADALQDFYFITHTTNRSEQRTK